MVEKGIAPAYIFAVFGGIAQLVERVVRNDEAWGSNPHTSTKFIGPRASSWISPSTRMTKGDGAELRATC
jgi:hypothetical protein